MLYCAGVLGRLFAFAFAWREAAAADYRSVEYASSSYDYGVDGESRRGVLKPLEDDLLLLLRLLLR